MPVLTPKCLPLVLGLSVAFLLVGCETVDKALYHTANATSQQDLITGQRVLSIRDRAQQITEGNKHAEQYLQRLIQEGVRINDQCGPQRYAQVNDIFKRVLSVSHLRSESWTVILLEDPELNAFVMGGTYVFVNTGLIDQAASIDEIAAVMGHEIAHVVANHIFEREGQQLATGLVKSNSAKRDSFRSSFTHEQEAEADRIGILYCALAGFDPNAAANLWQRIASEQITFRGAGLYYTHPISRERAANTQTVANAVSRYYTPGRINRDFESLLSNNVLWQRQAAHNLEPGKGAGFAAVIEAAASAVLAHQKAKLEEARQTSLNLATEHVRSKVQQQNHALISPTKLRVQFYYGGIYRIQGMQVAAVFQAHGYEPTRLITDVGAINAQGSYIVDFQHPQMAQLAQFFRGFEILSVYTQ